MRPSKLRRLAVSRAVVAVATLAFFTSDAVEAGIISSGDLLTVSSDNSLRSYTSAGVLQETLQITGLSSPLAVTGVAQGVTVLDDRLFVGLVSTLGRFTPKILEVNSTTGLVIGTYDTATPQLTALGDDGTHLLLLDSVNLLDVYTYTTGGDFVSKVAMTRPYAGNNQAEGIDGDGSSIFMSYNSNNQSILTNAASGASLGYFDTNVSPLLLFGGLAYDRGDDSLWIAGVGEFRHYDRMGNLLSVANTGRGNTGVTGLEVISASGNAVVPEPSSFVLLALGMLASVGSAARRRRTSSRSTTSVSDIAGNSNSRHSSHRPTSCASLV